LWFWSRASAFINWSYDRYGAMIAPDAEAERMELAPAAALFRSLGDPARLMIVRRLAVGADNLIHVTRPGDIR
jgi:hypothetical protein